MNRLIRIARRAVALPAALAIVILLACTDADDDAYVPPDSPDGTWILERTEAWWYQEGVLNRDSVDLDTHEEYSMRLRVLRGDTVVYAQYLMDGRHFDTLTFTPLDDSLRLFNGADTVSWSYEGRRLVLEFRRRVNGRESRQTNRLLRYDGTFPPPSWTIPLPPDAFEPDDAPAAAVPITVGAKARSRSLHTRDLDWFRFDARVGVTYVFETFGNTDTFLEVYGASPDTIRAANDDGGEGGNARIEWTSPAAGVAYFKVRRYGDYSVGPYRVSVVARP